MNIKARIGAQLDGDLAAIIFEPIEARARRARQVIQSEMAAAMGDVRRAARVGGAGRGGAGGAGGGGPYRTPASEGITRDMERQVERAARERLRLERALRGQEWLALGHAMAVYVRPSLALGPDRGAMSC